MTLLRMALPEAPVRRLPAHLVTAATAEPTDGFYGEEMEDGEPFRWMGLTGSADFAPADINRFLEFSVASEFHDLSHELTITVGGRSAKGSLAPGWMRVSCPVPAGASRVDFSVNKLFPREYYAGADTRDLGVRMRSLILHHDEARHQLTTNRQRNTVMNVREMLAGRSALESTPTSLGIDLYGACNVKPPCVYCMWDWSKGLEGDQVDTPFTTETLQEWGPFFDNSNNLVNCSIGEPFMMKNIDEMLDAFGDGGKTLEMATNGQILTDRNIQKLLGRSVDLYVSLDAATPETYAKLRNTRFDSILVNLRRLIEAKGGPGRFPKVQLVFMPMRVNLHELDKFVELCADLRVDRLVLRPLNWSETLALDWDRGGYRFEYQNELLPFDELVRASGRAAELCKRAGVQLSDQMDFGGSMGKQFAELFEQGRASVVQEAQDRQVVQESKAVQESTVAPKTDAAPLPSLGGEKKPACTEPWKSLYILRRGVLPCCYGGFPIAPMTEYREAWNSKLMQDIRTDLTNGRFHNYCLDSPACPIVRKAMQANELPMAAKAGMQRRHAAVLFERHVWSRVRWASEWSAIRLKRSVTEPAYWKKHASRAWRTITRTS